MIFAYLDPGAGSMIVQALIATALAVPLFFRSKVSAVVRKLRGEQEQTSPATRTADDASPD
jgi:hypothetical protein